MFKKQAKRIEAKRQISVDNPCFCCYAAYKTPDKLEETEKVLGLAMDQGSDQPR